MCQVRPKVQKLLKRKNCICDGDDGYSIHLQQLSNIVGYEKLAHPYSIIKCTSSGHTVYSQFICVLLFAGLKGLQGLEMGLLAVEVEGHPGGGGGCRTMIGVAEGRALGGCGEKIRGWMCG